jgi:glycosyltransferase involved in cell wall biosynthesis
MEKMSIIIPTYNEEKNISSCLKSIFNQDYPKNLLQVLVIDGNSKDKTVEIAKSLGAEVHITNFPNEDLKRHFAIMKLAKGNIIGLIDADNRIPENKNWLKKMMLPFKEKSIIGVDTLFYSFNDNDNIITKYCALIGGDDPFASYLGINDRLCFFNGKWTGMPHKEIDKKDYIVTILEKNKIPTIGSNGFFFRKSVFFKIKNDPFIHTDIIYHLVNKGYNKFAKVKQGFTHIQKPSLLGFFKKKIRRMKRRISGEVKLDYNYDFSKKQLIKTGLYIATVILPIIDAIKGYKRKPSIAWILHPFISLALLFIYAFYSLKEINIKYK